MKAPTLSILLTAALAGCTTLPEEPEPHETKFAVQVVAANVAEGVFPRTFPTNEENREEACKLANRIFEHPETRIETFPVIYVDAESAAVIDTTESVLHPVSYSMVEGKVVVTEQEYKLGKLVEVTINDADRFAATYTIDASYLRLNGSDEHTAGDGSRVSIPYFEKTAIKTSMTQVYNSWALLGGLVEKDGKGNPSELIFCTRIIAPIRTKTY